MNKKQIKATLQSMAKSNGSYNRLIVQMDENPDAADKWLSELEQMNFSDEVELIMFLES